MTMRAESSTADTLRIPAPVAQGIERAPPERKVAGSIPARRIFCCAGGDGRFTRPSPKTAGTSKSPTKVEREARLSSAQREVAGSIPAGRMTVLRAGDPAVSRAPRTGQHPRRAHRPHHRGGRRRQPTSQSGNTRTGASDEPSSTVGRPGQLVESRALPPDRGAEQPDVRTVGRRGRE